MYSLILHDEDEKYLVEWTGILHEDGTLEINAGVKYSESERTLQKFRITAKLKNAVMEQMHTATHEVGSKNEWRNRRKLYAVVPVDRREMLGVIGFRMYEHIRDRFDMELQRYHYFQRIPGLPFMAVRVNLDSEHESRGWLVHSLKDDE